jgi:cytochrome d ubiquinol oxidase subunit II
MGLGWNLPHVGFAVITALFLAVAYSFIGATWIIRKTDGPLQIKAVQWAKGGIWGVVLGLGSVSLATPLVSTRIFDKWFAAPQIYWLAPLPIVSVLLIISIWWLLRRLPAPSDRWSRLPFAATIALFTLGFVGMAYSFYPYVVPERLTIYEAASAPESLWIILIGVFFVLPMILGYTVLSYFIFRGKATSLSYD